MYLYGASGHGKVIKEILESQHKIVEGFIDDNPGVSVIGGLPVKHSLNGDEEIVVSIGKNRIRKKVVEKLVCKIAKAAIHQQSIVSKAAMVGDGSVVMAGAIINAEAKIGKHCIINTGASVDHECVIEDYVHIAPHASLCGNVFVGEGSLVGVGASIIPGVHIGRWCVIGAGAAVVEDVPDYSVAVGVPAKIIKNKNYECI